MEKKGFFNSLLFKLVLAIIVGIFLGLMANESIIMVVDVIKNTLGGLVSYIVPLIILGFIAPAIVSLKENAGRILSVTLAICYMSSVGAAAFSMISGYIIIPGLNIASNIAGAKEIPEAIFSLDIAPIMPVMTALITAILIGLAVIWSKAYAWETRLMRFYDMVLAIVYIVV